MKKKEVLKFLVGPLFVAIVFFLINLFLVFCHEQWYDESVPWTMAKNMNFSNFYEVMSVEPHPPLWYLMLVPLVKFGLPYICGNILSLLVVTLAVYLFVKKSPFSKPITIVLLFTSMFFYFNGVIARDYCLVVLGLVAVACLYQDRLKHPIKYCLAIVLLSQSHILLGALAACLAVAFFVEMIQGNKKSQKERIKTPVWKFVLYCALLVGSLASMLPQVIGTLKDHGIVQSSLSNFSFENILITINAFSEALIGFATPAILIIVLIPLIYLYGKNLKVFFFFLIEIVYYFVVLGYVYNAADALPQRVAIVTEVIIFAVWIVQYETHRKKNRIANLCKKSVLYSLITKYVPAGTLCVMCTFITIPQSVSAAIEDINYNYSQSHEVADWMNENIEDGAIVVVSGLNDEMGLSVVVPLVKDSITLYSVMYHKEFEYSAYYNNLEEYTVKDEDFLTEVEELSKDHQVYYFRIVGDCGSSALTYTPDDSWRIQRIFYGGYGGYGAEPIIRIYKVPANFKIESNK